MCAVSGGSVETKEQAEMLEEWGASIGQDLPPCQPAGVLEEILARTGRPCPRIELSPRNIESWELMKVLIREDTRSAFAPLFEALGSVLTQEERLGVLRRVINALNDRDVCEILYPDPKRKR